MKVLTWLASGLLLAATMSLTTAPLTAQTTSEDSQEAEAFALGYQAYVTGAVYARSQILMEKDINPAAPLNAPLNRFNIYPDLANPTSAIDFTPNNDTIYGLAWLDLRQGPVLMTIPMVPDRYWVVQATDWALNSLDYVGSRVNSKAGTYAYVPPGWKGTLPEGVTRIESTTSGVFLQARVVVIPETKADIGKVVAMLKTFSLRSLNTNATYMEVPAGTPLPNPKLSNPMWQSLEFFSLLNRAWAFGGVREQDREVAGLARPLGIGPGLTFNPDALTEAQKRGLLRAEKAAFNRIRLHAREIGRMENGWRISTDIGAYGDNRLMASTVGFSGYGGNIAEEAMYLPVFIDKSGESFNGTNRYEIHFAADQLPPVNSFWSVTLYDLPNNQLVANPINRYAIGDRTPGLKRNRDGSITLRIQHERPSKGGAANWLPSPEGNFWMILRMYGPKPSVLRGSYAPPAVEKVGAMKVGVQAK